jgi:hypothetical protein
VLGALRQKAAALLPLPWLLRRSGGDGGGITGFFGAGANAAPLAERAAALLAVAALAGAGGAALGTGALPGDRDAAGHGSVAAERSAHHTEELQRGAVGAAATDGERRGIRRASGQRDSGQAGGRAGGSTGTEAAPTGSQDGGPTGGSGAPATGTGGSLPSLDGSTPDLGTVPKTDGGSQPPSVPLNVQTPELPPVEVQDPAGSLPQVELPAAPLPNVDDVTDALPPLP